MGNNCGKRQVCPDRVTCDQVGAVSNKEDVGHCTLKSLLTYVFCLTEPAYEVDYQVVEPRPMPGARNQLYDSDDSTVLELLDSGPDQEYHGARLQLYDPDGPNQEYQTVELN